MTIVVREVEPAERFFGLLGFERDKAVVISGEPFATYMGVPGIEAEHVTLVLARATPRVEVQLLRYRQPDAIPDPDLTTLREVGFNHVCFAVYDLDGELARLREGGVETRSPVMEFHDRKLVFLRGPEGVTIELAEWR